MIRHTAIIAPDGLTIRASVIAGIDGPVFHREFPQDTAVPSLDEVDQILTERSYQRSEQWNPKRTYAGLVLEADIFPI